MGCLEALAHSRVTISDEILTFRDPSERALTCSENLTMALLPRQLTAGGRQLPGEPVSHCHLVPSGEATQQKPWPLVGRGAPLIRQTADEDVPVDL